MKTKLQHGIEWVDNKSEQGNLACVGYADNGARYYLFFSFGPVSFRWSNDIKDKQARDGAKFAAVKEYSDLNYEDHLRGSDGQINEYTFAEARALCERDYERHRARKVIEWVEPSGFRERSNFPPRTQKIGLNHAKKIKYVITRLNGEAAHDRGIAPGNDYLAGKFERQGRVKILNLITKKFFRKLHVSNSYEKCAQLCVNDNEKVLTRAYE